MTMSHEVPSTAPGGPDQEREPGAPPGTAAVHAPAAVRPRREVMYFALHDGRIIFGAAVIMFFVVLAIVGR